MIRICSLLRPRRQGGPRNGVPAIPEHRGSIGDIGSACERIGITAPTGCSMAKRTMNPVPNGPRKPAARAKASKKPAVREVKATRMPSAGQIQPLDLSAFPTESVVTVEKWLCLACVSDVFTRHLDLSPHRLSRNQAIYTSPNRIACAADTRPWFCNRPLKKACPYCGSSAKWHARLWVYRIESGKGRPAPRSHQIAATG